MSPSEKQTLFQEFLSEWQEQFNKIPSILDYIASYPQLSEKLNDFEPLNFYALKRSQLEWVSLVARFDHPVEKVFFKPYWVPIQEDGYDYFIDLSDPRLPIFEPYYFFYEPYRWTKRMLFDDISKFLTAPDDGMVYVNEQVKESTEWFDKKMKEIFNERDKLGFEGKIKPGKSEIKEISKNLFHTKFHIERNSFIISGASPLAVFILGLDTKIKLLKFEAGYKRDKEVLDLVKTVGALIYLVYNTGESNIDGFQFTFLKNQKASVLFHDFTLTIEDENVQVLNEINARYQKLRTKYT